ncbi:MAG: Dyp-type peroxidase [Ilumatobacteraceae bacterium]
MSRAARDRDPFRGTSRRSFLTRSAVAATGAGLAIAGCTSDGDETVGNEGDGASGDAPYNDALPAASALVAFRGERQAGIVAPAAAAGVVAGLDVRLAGRAALADLLATVSAEIERVMSGMGYERRSGGFPPLDTGILGPVPGPTGTSVIVGFGASLFDDRFGLAEQRPDQLIEMPHFRNDRLVDPERSHGDLSLVVQADTQDAANHALRQVLRRTRGDLAVRWVREGFNTLDRAAKPGTAPARNLMGFKDGTANPHVDDAAAMDAHVWIQPGDGQPAWSVGGSFQAIRVIRMQVEFWDRTRLNEQEALIGRHRDSGAPLGAELETDVPTFADGLKSHIARANPRTAGSERNIILRRPFSYVGGVDPNSQLDQGLLFTCYQRSLADGFMTVQERLEGEALEEYIRPLGGGFFVVPPGPGDGGGYLGQSLLDA